MPPGTLKFSQKKCTLPQNCTHCEKNGLQVDRYPPLHRERNYYVLAVLLNIHPDITPHPNEPLYRSPARQQVEGTRQHSRQTSLCANRVHAPTT